MWLIFIISLSSKSLICNFLTLHQRSFGQYRLLLSCVRFAISHRPLLLYVWRLAFIDSLEWVLLLESLKLFGFRLEGRVGFRTRNRRLGWPVSVISICPDAILNSTLDCSLLIIIYSISPEEYFLIYNLGINTFVSITIGIQYLAWIDSIGMIFDFSDCYLLIEKT